ncbi:MAG: flagellar motor protein MotA [Rhodospirillaceae bacterium]
MKSPVAHLTKMSVFLIVVTVFLAVLSPTLIDAFMANAALNGLILGVLILGIVYLIRQPLLLIRESNWLDHYRLNRPVLQKIKPPKLIAPIATMLGERGTITSLSAVSQRSLLDGLASRLEETRDLSRYMIGLLIFLGLLGTFWGLLQTINSVGGVIGGLNSGSGDLAEVFGELKKGLQAPLAGMGTAFSSSLFGLAGSLILGFLELQSGQAQNNFYNEVEEWLARQTKLSSGTLAFADGEVGVPAYLEALLEKTADNLESLQRLMERGEDSRITANQSISQLANKMTLLTDQMRAEQSIMAKVGEGQLEIRHLLAGLTDSLSKQSELPASSETELRRIVSHMESLLTEMVKGRAEIISELRSEIRVLSRTIAAAAERNSRL